MILVDANLLIYCADRRSPHHVAAESWLQGVLAGSHRVGLPWAATMAYVRIVSNPRMSAKPTSVPRAWGQVREWLSSPVAWIPEPTPDHAALLDQLLATPGLQANDVPDVHLAAIALGHGLQIASHDQGFARFESAGVRWFDPLRES